MKDSHKTTDDWQVSFRPNDLTYINSIGIAESLSKKRKKQRTILIITRRAWNDNKKRWQTNIKYQNIWRLIKI